MYKGEEDEIWVRVETIEEAEEIIRQHKKQVLIWEKYYGEIYSESQNVRKMVKFKGREIKKPPVPTKSPFSSPFSTEMVKR